MPAELSTRTYVDPTNGTDFMLELYRFSLQILSPLYRHWERWNTRDAKFESKLQWRPFIARFIIANIL